LPLEEDVIERNILNTNGFLITDDLDHAIDHQHWIAMRQNSLDPADVQGGIAIDGCEARIGRLLQN